MKIKLPLIEKNLKPARDFVDQWTKSFEHKKLSAFTLVASEVITNLLKHAQQRADQFEIELKVSGNRWTMNIRDDGSPFEEFEQKIEQAHDQFEDLMTSGMGLGLIKQMVDEYHYFPDDMGKNCYRFVIEIEPEVTIAVIDDDPSILVLLEAYLENNYRVLSFEDGITALEYLKRHTVDLIVSDLNMPGIDGIGLRKSVQESLGSIPFIFLTGESTDALHRLSIDDVLHKPVNKHQLLETIDRVLIRHRELTASISRQLAPSISRQLSPQIKTRLSGYQWLLVSRTAYAGGGDFIFEHFDEHRNEQLILLGDVMGHDQQAKFFVHAYQGFLQGTCHALQSLSDPSKMLDALSQGVCHSELLGSSLLTALAINLKDDGWAQIACAGHCQPLQLSGNQWSAIPVEGPLLGFQDSQSYQAHHVRVDSPIVFYTDGLLEPLSEEEREHLLSLLAETISNREASLDAVMDYYDNRVGPQVPDDMTLMVLMPQ